MDRRTRCSYNFVGSPDYRQPNSVVYPVLDPSRHLWPWHCYFGSHQGKNPLMAQVIKTSLTFFDLCSPILCISQSMKGALPHFGRALLALLGIFDRQTLPNARSTRVLLLSTTCLKPIWPMFTYFSSFPIYRQVRAIILCAPDGNQLLHFAPPPFWSHPISLSFVYLKGYSEELILYTSWCLYYELCATFAPCSFFSRWRATLLRLVDVGSHHFRSILSHISTRRGYNN